MIKSAIKFKDVTFKYESQSEPTLKNINLTINSGEKVLIAGPSGSGKSTLGNLINGIIPHSLTGDLSGKVIVDGINIVNSDISELSTKVGTVLQNSNNQFVGLTTAEDIAFSQENDNVQQTKMQEEVKKWANKLDLNNLLNQSPQNLSGGQKQRATLAGVLIDNNRNLLFDEPLASLDPLTGKNTMKLIDKIHKILKMTTIIIEHRIEDVLSQSIDRIIILNDGKIVSNDRPDVILKKSILNKLGLREPLYIEALKAANINLNKITNIDNVNNIDGPNLNKSLNKLNEPFKMNHSNKNHPLIKLSNIDFKYNNKQKIFKDLNLNINKGDRLALVGKNGVGKSTLSKIITGFAKPNRGKVSLNNKSLDNQSIKERADKIGYIMQDPDKMISKVMIRDEVSLGLKLRGLNEEEIKPRVDKILKICGLYPFRNWPISALSFGQKKRVTIASILVLNPEILILDEPTAGQDFYHYSNMMKFLINLNQKGVTMVFITHDMHLMLEYANRTVVLGNKNILADNIPSKILSNQDLCPEANLKPTSLYSLANRFNLNPLNFTQSVINYELRRQSK